jgi:hypothetical protein
VELFRQTMRKNITYIGEQAAYTSNVIISRDFCLPLSEMQNDHVITRPSMGQSLLRAIARCRSSIDLTMYKAACNSRLGSTYLTEGLRPDQGVNSSAAL